MHLLGNARDHPHKFTNHEQVWDRWFITIQGQKKKERLLMLPGDLGSSSLVLDFAGKKMVGRANLKKFQTIASAFFGCGKKSHHYAACQSVRKKWVRSWDGSGVSADWAKGFRDIPEEPPSEPRIRPQQQRWGAVSSGTRIFPGKRRSRCALTPHVVCRTDTGIWAI